MFEVAAFAFEFEETGDGDIKASYVALVVQSVLGFQIALEVYGGEVQVECEFLKLHVAIVDRPLPDVCAGGVDLGTDDDAAIDVNLVLKEADAATDFEGDLAVGVSRRELGEVEGEGAEVFLLRCQRPLTEVEVEGFGIGADVVLVALHEDLQGGIMHFLLAVLACLAFVFGLLAQGNPVTPMDVGEAHLGEVDIRNLQLQRKVLALFL